MIPSLGATEVGPFATMIVASFAAVVVALVVIPWTVARDRAQLRTRGRITVALMIIGGGLAAVAAFVPYQRDGRCPAALPAYGFGLEALATMDSQDRCAVPGQLLVAFSGSIIISEGIAALLWFLSRDPVLDVRRDEPSNG